MLNNFRVNRALLSNFMFLDPSHRNERVSISGNLGAKGKYQLTVNGIQRAHLFLDKTECRLSFKLSILYTVSSSTTESLSELIFCLHRVKSLGRLDS